MKFAESVLNPATEQFEIVDSYLAEIYEFSALYASPLSLKSQEDCSDLPFFFGSLNSSVSHDYN